MEDLLQESERIKAILVQRARGEGAEEAEYQRIRRVLIGAPSIKSKLPAVVRTYRTLREFWGFIKPRFTTYREREAFLVEQFEPLLSELEGNTSAPLDATVWGPLKETGWRHVQDGWQKALERRANDPDGALTAARTLLESVCKHILDEAGVSYGAHEELPKLYSLAAGALNLSPSQHTEKIFKQILGGCQSIVEGLGALRSRIGDAHGQGKVAVKPAARHAELAVNIAGSVASFLVLTWIKSQTGNEPFLVD